MKDRIRDIVLYGYLLRVPILMVALIWPILPYGFSTPLFRGLADLQAGGDVSPVFGTVYATSAAFLSLAAAITIAILIAQNAGTRVYESPSVLHFQSGWISGFVITGALVYVLFIWSLWKANRGLGWIVFWEGVGLGVLFGAFSLLVASGFSELFIPKSTVPDRDPPGVAPPPIPQELKPLAVFVARVSRATLDLSGRYIARPYTWVLSKLGPGFYETDAIGTTVGPTRVAAFATALFLLSVLIYLTGAASQDRHSYPTLFWVIGSTTGVLWMVAILAYWLDRYRAPVLAVLGACLVIFSIFFGSDSYYGTHDVKNRDARLLTPRQVIGLPRFQPRLILVSAAGGGIHAAGWTARVLTGLKEDLGEQFDSRIAVVSGVSGGSVGSFFYLRSLRGYPRETLMPSEAFNGAVKSSLEDVALRLFRDRGEALEESIADHAEARHADLQDLAANVDKNFPVVIFNATMATAARPLVFTNSAFPDDSQDVDSLRGSIRSFHKQCANQDTNIETAVRMSATFPFVSPAARAHLDCLSEHLVDGGYYDNSGLTALNTWLRQAVGKESWESPGALSEIREILLIQIVSFPKDEEASTADEHWLYQLTVPLSVMLNVRGTGQTLRNQAESWAVTKSIRGRMNIQNVVFRYAPDDCACSSKTPSLSWHLSKAEIDCLRTAWQEGRMKPCRDTVARFVKNSSSPTGQLNVCQE